MYGAAAILAHPFLNLTYNGLTEFLPLAKEAGLDAIETRYSMFDEKTTEKAIELAQRFGLKQSGGSDFHGKAKPDIDLGNGRGTLSVPFSFYESLRPEQKE
jgi:predicted metal-dependent phosphoesterase TrpH